MDRKRLLGVEIKNADRGEVEAVFATFGVKDTDGDVTLPGAFENGAPVRISAYGHGSWDGRLPVGKGVIRTGVTESAVAGRFFLQTTGGRDTFEVVKEMGPLQEWSYGYDALDTYAGDHKGERVRFLPKQIVHEVSPVLVGAGVGTRTLSTKSGLKFSDEAAEVMASVTALVDRAVDVLAKRREGKGLGGDTSALLEGVEAELKRLTAVLAAPQTDPEDMQREYLRYLALTSKLAKEYA